MTQYYMYRCEKKSWDLFGWNLVGGKILPFILYCTTHFGPPISIETQKGMDWIDGTGHNILKVEKKCINSSTQLDST